MIERIPPFPSCSQFGKKLFRIRKFTSNPNRFLWIATFTQTQLESLKEIFLNVETNRTLRRFGASFVCRERTLPNRKIHKHPVRLPMPLPATPSQLRAFFAALSAGRHEMTGVM
jgi:hypothetical protein